MLSIGWYARDGHLDVFPSVSRRLQERGLRFQAHFACHNAIEATHLERSYGVTNPWILGRYLGQRRQTRDISHARVVELERRYSSVLPLIRCAWGDLFEKNIREPELTHNIIGHIEFWEDFVTSHSLDALVIEVPSIVSTCAAWIVCRRAGVQLLSYVDLAPLGDRALVTNTWDGSYDQFESALAEEPDPASLAEAERYLQAFDARPQRTLAARRRSELREYERVPFELFRYLSAIRSFVQRERLKREYYVRSSGLEWLSRWARSYWTLKRLRIQNVFDPVPSDPAPPYILFPLHQLNEWSDYAWMGLRYADQARTVCDISAALPLGRELHVKEHTAGFGERPFEFYRRVRRCRNVRLIHPDEDGFRLLRNAQALVTLGSSMGFEALLMGRPVILLSDAWYRNCPGVYRAGSPEELGDLLQSATDLTVASESQKLRIVGALFKISFPAVKYPHPQTLTDENIDRWASGLMARLRQNTAERVRHQSVIAQVSVS